MEWRARTPSVANYGCGGSAVGTEGGWGRCCTVVGLWGQRTPRDLMMGNAHE